MKKPYSLNLLSMEELSHLSRNIGEESMLRQSALRELCKRENTKLQQNGWRTLTPQDYAAHDLL